MYPLCGEASLMKLGAEPCANPMPDRSIEPVSLDGSQAAAELFGMVTPSKTVNALKEGTNGLRAERLPPAGW